MANDIKLQESHPVDENLRPLKVGGELSSLEIAKSGARVSGNLEVSDDIVLNGNIIGGTEFGWFSLDDDGTQDANENNYGLGSTVTSTMVSNNISWDDTNKVIAISKAGVYEVFCNALISINATIATTLKVYINTAADTLGTEVHSAEFEVDSGDDPVPASINWIGRINSGDYIAVTIDGGGRYPVFKTGSTLSIKSLTGA